MHPTLQALLGLQQIDRKLYRVEAELERLPRELARREEDLNQKARRHLELEEQARRLRSESKEIEDFTTGMRQRQRKLESESTSRKIDAAMLASYEHEIRTLKRGISEAEEEAIKKLGAAETLEGEASEVEARLSEERATFEEFKANVEREVADAEARRAELAKERESASAEGVSPEALELYRRLLVTREGEALAELADGHCQSCFVQIPRNLGVRLARGQVVQCPSCTRILYSAV